MKKLLALLLLLWAVPTFAVDPPDVPAYITITPSYAAGSTANVTATGTPPAYAVMPANIPNSTTGWIIGTGISYCNLTNATGPCGHQGDTKKFRTEANTSHILYDDAIRNYGAPGTSHCHMFYGNAGANAFSTYSRLRARPSSTSAGGPVNASAYWFPCIVKTNPFGNSKNYAVKMDRATFYYTDNTTSTATGDGVYIPVGMRFVFGTNMDDPDDLAVKAEIALANAQSGTAGRYAYIGNGFGGWHCVSTGEVKPDLVSFVTPCPSSSQIYAEANSAPCWDGQNIYAPAGYKHMRQFIQDNTLGKPVCPTGWYHVFSIELKVLLTHSGSADYTTWRLSSDNAAATAAGHAINNGGSFHTDYIMGWNDIVLRSAADFCLGVNGQTGHECDFSTLNATQRLITLENAPDGSRSPQLPSVTYGTATASAMFQLPTQSNGPVVLNSN